MATSSPVKATITLLRHARRWVCAASLALLASACTATVLGGNGIDAGNQHDGAPSADLGFDGNVPDANRNDGGTDLGIDARVEPDGGTPPVECGAGTFEFPFNSRQCVDDACLPDACGGSGTCINESGSAVCIPCDYFVDATAGLDTNPGTSASSPWQTLSKVSAASLVAGDHVCFKRGEVFHGSLVLTRSGDAGNPISFGDYGEGAKPVLSGLTSISSWTSAGTNLWEATIPGGLATLNAVVVGDTMTPLGRYPNADAPNGGYLTYESSVINTSLTDNELSASPSFTGGEVVFRRTFWQTDRAPITSHSGSTISFSVAATSTELVPGFGYFIENHAATLDRDGEWMHDTSAGGNKIRMYYSGEPPAVEVANVQTLVDLSTGGTKSSLAFHNLTLRGSEGTTINVRDANDITFDGCDILYSGVNGIDIQDVDGITLQYSRIADANMIGIADLGNSSNITIARNTLLRVGIRPGMINNGYGEGTSNSGMNLRAENLLVSENTIDDVGYAGIAISSNNNQVVRNNIVSRFCSVKNDGGAIYSRRFDSIAYDDIVIDGNIIFDGIGAPDGAPPSEQKQTRAIYLDANSYGVTISNNTIYDTPSGIFISQTQNVTASGNTVFNAGEYSLETYSFSAAFEINDTFAGFPHVTGLDITNNIFFASHATTLPYLQLDAFGDANEVGTIDNNYYVNAVTGAPALVVGTGSGTPVIPFSVGKWQREHPSRDQNSHAGPFLVPEWTAALTSANRFPNETFDSNTSGTNADSPNGNHAYVWDGTGQITGPGSARLSFPTSLDQFTNFSGVVGAISASHAYVVRFKTRGSTNAGIFRMSLLQYHDAYSVLTPKQYGSFGEGIEQHEIFFTDVPDDANVALYIEFMQSSGTVFIDDVQFFEANLSPTDFTNRVRLETNPTSLPVNRPLASDYFAVDGTPRTGSITLLPYSSIILMRR